MKKVNWGIIGLGNAALEFAKSFENVDNAKLVSIASKNPYKLKLFKEKFKIKKELIFKNYEDLLSSKEVEAIYISLPNSLHYKWSINCIKNNKKFLVEKPATINLQEIQNIKKELYGKNLFFAEAFMYRHHPQIKKVIELINKNIIGQVISMESDFGKDIMTKKNIFGFKKEKKIKEENRLFNKNLGGSPILDMGCYPVSLSLLVASLMSNIDLENIKIKNKMKEMGPTNVDIDASITLEFSNKFICKLRTSFKKNLGKKTIIHGEKGQIIIEDTWHANPAIIMLKNNKAEQKEIKIEFIKNVYSYQLEAVNDSIIKDKNELIFPGMKINETLLNMKILDAWRN